MRVCNVSEGIKTIAKQNHHKTKLNTATLLGILQIFITFQFQIRHSKPSLSAHSMAITYGMIFGVSQETLKIAKIFVQRLKVAKLLYGNNGFADSCIQYKIICVLKRRCQEKLSMNQPIDLPIQMVTLILNLIFFNSDKLFYRDGK